MKLEIEKLRLDIEKEESPIKKVMLYYELAFSLLGENRSKVIEYSEIAYELSKEIEYEEGIKYFIGFEVYRNTILPERETDFDLIRDAIGYFDKIQDDKMLGFVLHLSGYEHIRHLNYEKAIKEYEESIRVNRKSNSKTRMLIAYNNLSNIYFQQGDFKEEYKIYEEVFKEFEIKEIEDTASYMFYNIANNYNMFNRIDDGISICKIGYKASHKRNKIEEMCDILSIYGTLLHKKGKVKLAEKILLHAVEKAKEITNLEKMISNAIANRAASEYYGRMNDSDKALEYLVKAYVFASKSDERKFTLNTLKDLVFLYKERNEFKKAFTVYRHFSKVEEKFKEEKKQLMMQTIQMDAEVQFEKDKNLMLNKFLNFDGLTNAYSRRYLFKKLQEYEKNKNPAAVLMFDLDNFKNINDTFGHATGDKALINIVLSTNKYIGEDGFISRLGGDEFVIVFNTTEYKKINGILEKIANDIKTTKYQDVNLVVTISGGVALLLDKTPDEVIAEADLLLYDAKKTTKDKILYSNEIKGL